MVSNDSKWHKVYLVGLLLKSLNAILELIAGFIFLFGSPDTIRRAVFTLIRPELAEDPGDLVANLLAAFSSRLSIDTSHFLALYLLTHGLFKALLILGIIRKKLWTYPLFITVLMTFSVYQIYKFTLKGSALLLALTVLDIAMAWLTWKEYQALRKK